MTDCQKSRQNKTENPIDELSSIEDEQLAKHLGYSPDELDLHLPELLSEAEDEAARGELGEDFFEFAKRLREEFK